MELPFLARSSAVNPPATGAATNVRLVALGWFAASLFMWWLAWPPAHVAAQAAAANPDPSPRVVRIAVSARQFAFDPGIITVQKGDRVVLELTSTDVLHGLYLDGYGLDARLVPGQTVSLEFTADRTGRWMFRCSETCGPFHPYMIGWLRVEPNPYAAAGWWGSGLVAAGAIGFFLFRGVKP